MPNIYLIALKQIGIIKQHVSIGFCKTPSNYDPRRTKGIQHLLDDFHHTCHLLNSQYAHCVLRKTQTYANLTFSFSIIHS